MYIYQDITRLPSFKNAVVTIGIFDGVHTGHKQIIRLLQSEAVAIGGETVVITFHPHPKMALAAASQPIYILNTLNEKIDLLEKYGIQHLAIIPFTETFAKQPAEKYISNFLVKNFHPHTIVIGYDHRFGVSRKGDYRLLEEKAVENNYRVKEIPEYILQDVTISSTKIREALLRADIETANMFLGYIYFFSAIVVEGNKLGRTIGFPTANLHIEDEQKLIPANGVYTVEVELYDKKFQGMMNIGMRPTVNGKTRVVEVNIFNFDEEIYGKKIKLFIKKHLRSEIKFNNLDELKIQLAKDKETALKYLAV